MRTIILTMLILLCGVDSNAADVVLKKNVLAYNDDIKPTTQLKPIMIAAKTGDLKALMAAIENGDDVNGCTSCGATPLMLAAKYDNIQVMDVLLIKGADINAKNKYGLTAVDFARLYEHEEAYEFLINHQ